MARPSLCAMVLTVLAGAAAAQQTSKPEPSVVFSARDVVPASLLRGSNYTIDETVPVVNDRYLFTLRTPDGDVTAHGKAMLQVRLDEMRSLEQAKELDRQPQELEGIKDSVKATGRGFEALIKKPGETLSNIPRGVGRKIKSLTRKETYQGGSDTRRQFAAAVHCDPQTDNPPLKRMLDKLSLRRFIGRGVVDAAGFLATAGVATVVRGASALRTTNEMNELVRDTPLYKINDNIEDDLAGMGVSVDVRERFVKHEAMTTVQRMLFMQQYVQVRRLPGAPLLVQRALSTRDRGEAIQCIQTMELIARLHAAGLVSAVTEAEPLLLQLRNGEVLWIRPADYLTDSADLADALRAVQARHRDAKVVLLTDGRISAQAADRLARAGVRVVENGDVEGIGNVRK